MPNLLIQTAFLGDLLLAIPLIRAIKKKYQQPLFIVCRKGLGQLLLDLKLCDKVFEVERGNGKDKNQVFKNLKSLKFDLIFCPHQSFRTARLVSQLSANQKIGFYRWWNFLNFDVRIKRDPTLPDALRQLSLIEHPISVPNLKTRTTVIFNSLVPSPMKLLSETTKTKTILISPGSVWPTKRWTLQGFKELVIKLKDLDHSVVIIGSPDEKILCEEVAQGLVENKAGQLSLTELVHLMAKSQVLVTNDSGAMHLASVAGLKTVAMFGPTVLDFGYRPWQDQAIVVQQDLGCRPCAKHGGLKCPLGHHHCMTQISSDRVLGHILTLINSDDFGHQSSNLNH